MCRRSEVVIGWDGLMTMHVLSAFRDHVSAMFVQYTPLQKRHILLSKVLSLNSSVTLFTLIVYQIYHHKSLF